MVLVPPEILKLIFNNLVETTVESPFFPGGLKNLSKDSIKNLLSCALSSGALFDPAIRVLWHTMELPTILRLLPDFTIMNGTHNLTGDVDYDDHTLKRFDIYSSKVRHLALYGPASKQILIHNFVYTRLALARPRPLPFLTHLYCYGSPFSDKTIFAISPSLRYASFFQCHFSEILLYLSVAKKESELQLLDLSYCLGNEPTLPSISKSISQLIHLRSLHLIFRNLPGCVSLDLRPLGRLALLESLRLEIHVPNTKIESSIIQDFSDGVPRSLKQLTLYLDDPSASLASTVPQFYQHSPVVTYSIIGFLKSEQFATVFAAIPSQWQGTLTKLLVSACGPMEIDPPRSLRSSLIEPLYSLCVLQDVEIREFGSALFANDDDISKICHAWPDLVNLLLDVSSDSETVGRLPTVASFKPIIATLCPQMESLEIPLDVVRLPAVDEIHSRSEAATSSSGTSHDLHLLHLNIDRADFDQCSSGSGPTNLAYHLDMAFPFLRLVEVNHGVGKGRIRLGWKAWKAVIDIMVLCQDVRRRYQEELK
ncbi:hypothetical protein D9758_006460 [Tetrapyrgos nigripes]|uniref:Uncharacterized protein n=1 Tax=Tetrapyrgos nigripes TaxID=182062 RepID=A0A8H5GKQ2_9AGAR|nr:hypothetical protein D9758_006460 [Tetrapyrgos nigripes]